MPGLPVGKNCTQTNKKNRATTGAKIIVEDDS